MFHLQPKKEEWRIEKTTQKVKVPIGHWSPDSKPKEKKKEKHDQHEPITQMKRWANTLRDRQL